MRRWCGKRSAVVPLGPGRCVRLCWFVVLERSGVGLARAGCHGGSAVVGGGRASVHVGLVVHASRRGSCVVGGPRCGFPTAAPGDGGLAMKVLSAMSGGVDSSVATALLVQ